MSLRELKKVTEILGTILTKDEVDEFMKEADKVKILYKLHCKSISAGWRWDAGHRRVCEDVAAVWITTTQCCSP